MHILICLLGSLLAVNAVRIDIAPRFGISPNEPKLEFYNPLTPGVPAPVMEDSEPENRLLPQLPPGPRVPGLQIENVVQALRYRYPDPTTTPRPFSAAARYPIPPDFPTAYAQRRPDPLPTVPTIPNQQQVVFAPASNLITGNRIDIAEFQPHEHTQLIQAIRQQADAIQQQRQSQLATQQLQQAQDRLQQRLLMRQRLRQMILQQQQEEAFRQQTQQQFGQIATTADHLQNPLIQQNQNFQSSIQSQQPNYLIPAEQQNFQIAQSNLIIRPEENFQSEHSDFLQQPKITPLAEQPSEQPVSLIQPQQQVPVVSSGVSYSRTYHVSRVADHK